MKPENVNIYVHRGTDFELSVTLKDSDNVAINVTGDTGHAQIRKPPGTNPKGRGDLIDTLTVAVSDGPNGVFTVSAARADTYDYPIGNYYWEFARTRNADSKVLGPYLSGTVYIRDCCAMLAENNPLLVMGNPLLVNGGQLLVAS